MSPSTNIDGTEITGATIDGQDVQEITVDGDTVFTAIPDRTVFSFESGDLSNWRNTSEGSIVTSPVNEGAYACLVDGNEDNNVYSQPGDGLNYYPEPDGTEFIYAQYNADPGDHRFGWAASSGSTSSNSSGYEVAHRPGNGRFELNVDGSALDIDGTTPPTGEWLINYVTWASNGDISVRVDDADENTIANLSANDLTYTTQGEVYIAGRSTGNGGRVYFDAPQP